EHMARLAALALDEQALPALTEQLGRILDYISQLDGVEAGEGVADAPPGPRPPLREDIPNRTPLAIPLEQMAPLFRDGLFLVPRLGGVGSDLSHGEDE